MIANDLLDAHHSVVGVSDFGDDISDNCAVCGFAVGWPEDKVPSEFGHDTQGGEADVRRWIAGHCEKSPTGWHEFVVDTCCHCGTKQGGTE